MKNLVKYQQGFAVIEAILIIVIIAIAGGTGYYVYQSNNKAADTYDAAGDSASAVTQSNKKGANTDSRAEKYLVIKEWNVKIPLTEAISNANYRFENGYVYVGISGAGDICSASSSTGSIAAISRFTASEVDPDTNKTYLSAYDTLESAYRPTLLNGYYYSLKGSQAACSDDDAELAKASAAREAYVMQLKKITAN